jgi:pimeloyl-ACP methyl ester carboxylesterase
LLTVCASSVHFFPAEEPEDFFPAEEPEDAFIRVWGFPAKYRSYLYAHRPSIFFLRRNPKTPLLGYGGFLPNIGLAFSSVPPLLTLVAPGGVGAAMGSLVSSLLFQPPSLTFMHAQKHFWLQTRTKNRIPAFFIDRNSTVTVLFSHGNAEDLGMIYDWFYDFTRQLNVNVLAYDYTGYGKSSGTVSEQNCYADIDAAWDYLTTQRVIPSKQIFLYGRSLGSGPSCYLAERLARSGTPLGGLIIQSPLCSAYRVAFNFRFTLPGDMFPSIDRCKNIKCPVFIIHGTRDEVVPFWHGQELFLATPVQYRAKPFWVDGGGHNNIEALLRDDGTFFERLSSYLKEHSRVAVAGSPSNQIIG